MTTIVESLYDCRWGEFKSSVAKIDSHRVNSFHACARFCEENDDCEAFEVRINEDSTQGRCLLASSATHNTLEETSNTMFCESVDEPTNGSYM